MIDAAGLIHLVGAGPTSGCGAVQAAHFSAIDTASILAVDLLYFIADLLDEAVDVRAHID